MHVASIILATEPGSGFIESRWLAPWGGITLLEHVVRQVKAWPATPGVVVLGCDAEEVLAAVNLDGFTVIIDPEWSEGSGASLRTAFDFMARDDFMAGDEAPDVALVVDAAQPVLPAGLVDALLHHASTTERPAIVPKYRYAMGQPVLLRRWLWPVLVGVDRARDLTAALETNPEWVEALQLDVVPPMSIVTPDHLREAAPRR